MPSSVRVQKVADVIKREIVHTLQRELNDPRLKDVLIIDVIMSPDLGKGTVYFSIDDESAVAAAKKAFAKASGFIRHQLAKNTRLRYVPNLQFQYDTSIRRAERIQQLLDDVGDETGD